MMRVLQFKVVRLLKLTSAVVILIIFMFLLYGKSNKKHLSQTLGRFANYKREVGNFTVRFTLTIFVASALLSGSILYIYFFYI